MEKVVAKFDSFADAERAEREFYRRLSPVERLELQAELVRQHWRAQGGFGEPRLARVYRIVQRERR